MWFMNKVANPFVRLILKSPFHRLMSAAVLLLTYAGRKSGKKYQLPVQYVQESDHIFVIPGAPERKTWWRNLRGGAPVNLMIKGRICPGYANILQTEAEIIPALRVYLQRFPASAKVHQVRIEPNGSLNAEDLQQAAKQVVIVSIKLG